MAKLFDIQETTVAISNLSLIETQGNVTHAGAYDIAGNLNVQHNLTVSGTITADTFNVTNLVTENGSLASVGNWTYNSEEELNGKGFNWTHGTGNAQLLYRSGGRLWTNANVDIASTATYNIDDIPVLSASALGGGITSSNLTKVGTLQSLNVSGDASFAEFLFVDSTSNRIGIGTEEPSSAVEILDNNVSITLGSPAINTGAIGTKSNHDLLIVTDDLPRISIKRSGEVHIGDQYGGGGVLNVYGTLFATNLQTDNRVERTHPLLFNHTADSSIYGLGLIWAAESGPNKQLIMMASPDRLYSTESIDLAENQNYSINGQVVISSHGLGVNVTTSHLVTLGTLQSLSVAGDANFSSNVSASNLTLNDGTRLLTVAPGTINAVGSLDISVFENTILHGDGTQISIGNSSNPKPVKVFGKLSVGINNPDPDLNFSVNGDVNIGGKRFTSKPNAPESGTYEMGDICWNSNPQKGGSIGWVCIVTGTPGQWASFGTINNQ